MAVEGYVQRGWRAVFLMGCFVQSPPGVVSFLVGEQVPIGTLICVRCRMSPPPLRTDTDVDHSLPSHLQRASEWPDAST